MAASDLTAGTVMDGSASLLNDTAKSVYTYVAQIPYLRIALHELRELFELNSVPVTETSSVAIPVDAGQITISIVGPPTLPLDFVEPLQLWERNRGIDPYVPMWRKDFLPHNLEGRPTNQLMYWVWQEQMIKFLPSLQNNDVKIDYIKQLFPTIVDETSAINILNAQTFLEFRTAALCAEFIERNKTSSDAQNAYAILALDRVTGISSKGKQNIMTRRRPFRSGWKRRGWRT
jgi:hypothetical protein